MRAVWLFSRNDALANFAVVMATDLVAWTGTPWPDLVVALVIAGLFLQSSWSIARDARAARRRASRAEREFVVQARDRRLGHVEVGRHAPADGHRGLRASHALRAAISSPCAAMTASARARNSGSSPCSSTMRAMSMAP